MSTNYSPTNNSPNMLSVNPLNVERLQDDDSVTGYDYNRISDALSGLRNSVVTLTNVVLSGILFPLPYSDSVDAAHPMYIDYVATNGVIPTKATLSFKMRAYRAYISASGSGTTGTDSTGESGHSHSHGHTITLQSAGGNPAIFVGWNAGATQWQGNVVGATTGPATNSDATGSSGHNHSHNHTYNVTSSLGVTEGGTTTITNLLVDGVDKTSAVGGPWPGGTTTGIDLSKVLPTGDGQWHTIQLTPAGAGRIVAFLQVPL